MLSQSKIPRPFEYDLEDYNRKEIINTVDQTHLIADNLEPTKTEIVKETRSRNLYLILFLIIIAGALFALKKQIKK